MVCDDGLDGAGHDAQRCSRLAVRDAELQSHSGAGAFPPIVVGHSLGAAVVQVFLESYAAQRVIFVNPLCEAASLKRLPRQPSADDDMTMALRDSAFVAKLASGDPMLQEMLPALAKKKIAQAVIDQLIATPPKFDKDTGIPIMLIRARDDPFVDEADAAAVADKYDIAGALSSASFETRGS